MLEVCGVGLVSRVYPVQIQDRIRELTRGNREISGDGSLTANPFARGAFLAGRCVLLVLGIYAGGRLGHATAFGESRISLIWLPTGIAVGALFRWGLWSWPGVYLGVCMIQLAANPSTPLAS